MISSETEYQKAREELEELTRWLARLEDEGVPPRKGLTSASLRKMISRVQEELAEYEAGRVSAPPASAERTEPGDTGPKRQD